MISMAIAGHALRARNERALLDEPRDKPTIRAMRARAWPRGSRKTCFNRSVLPAGGDLSNSEELPRRLATEFEGDNSRVTGSTLAAVAQQYEDAFGPNTMRSS